MPLDLALFAEKLRRFRVQFGMTVEDVSVGTGIASETFQSLEGAEREPTGDEVLVLAEYFRCDYKFFISNSQQAPLEKTEKLFRKFGAELSTADRWAIQEFLYLSENEAFLEEKLSRRAVPPFRYAKVGKFFKRHGEEAAARLRTHIGYTSNQIPVDVFDDLRTIGVHVFRRELANSNISGLFINHPVAGKCVLVNYLEDVYRQRFTAVHEGGHSILDAEEDFVVSFKKWDHEDLVEVRANTFAANYLLPPEFLKQLPKTTWTDDSIVQLANRFRVNVDTLLYALEREHILDAAAASAFKGLRVARESKIDPELPSTLTDRQRLRKTELLRRGLSVHYVRLCFDAYDQGVVSAARVAEMMLCQEREVLDLGHLYGWSPSGGA